MVRRKSGLRRSIKNKREWANCKDCFNPYRLTNKDAHRLACERKRKRDDEFKVCPLVQDFSDEEAARIYDTQIGILPTKAKIRKRKAVLPRARHIRDSREELIEAMLWGAMRSPTEELKEVYARDRVRLFDIEHRGVGDKMYNYSPSPEERSFDEKELQAK